MKVIILGASLDALFLAHILTERDHNVSVYGPYMRSRSDPLAHRLPYSKGVRAVLPFADTLTRIEAGVLTDRTVVAKPKNDYNIVDDREVFEKLDLGRFESCVEIPEIHRSMYDVIVTCLHPSHYFGKGNAPEVGITWRSIVTDPTWREDTADDIKNLDKDIWWDRAVRCGSKWVVESIRQPTAKDAIFVQNRVFKSQIPLPSYPPFVVPAGPLPEWDKSANVFDNIDEYVFRIESKASVNQ